MKIFAAVAATVALVGRSAQAVAPASDLDHVALQGDPGATSGGVNTTATSGDVNVGDDDGSELIAPLLPDAASGVSLLADASAMSAPWSFNLAADESSRFVRGRELVSAVSVPLTSKECPVYARNANNVLIAVSSCFTKTTWDQIDAWITDLRKNDIRYFPGDTSAVGYDVKWVNDGCAAPTWCTQELKRDTPGKYIGVISITVHKQAADFVAQFIAINNLPSPIGYVYNGPTSLKAKPSDRTTSTVVQGSSSTISTTYEGYQVAKWNEIDKGFLCHTDLLDNLRKVHCSTLIGSKANLFVTGGARKCFCACADGFEFVGDVCKPKPKDEDCTCAWSTNKDGYKFVVDKAGTVCSVTTAGKIPVPVIGDNYVDRYRDNNGDLKTPLISPRITLIKQRNTVTLNGWSDATQDISSTDSTPYTWKDFQSSTNSPVTRLTFDKFGQYKIELQAFDYDSNATCAGCVTVVDSYRPTHHSNYPCPAPMTDTIAVFSSATVTKYKEAIQRLENFTKFALNDGCSQSYRCDDELKTTKTFIGGTYGSPVKSISDASSYFNTSFVKEDLSKKLTGSPLNAAGEVNMCSSPASDSVESCVQETCSRCIDVSTALREWWVDYQCDSSSAVARCQGTEPACALKQCLTVNASSILSASAQLKESVRTTSLTVLKAKEENKNKSDSAIALEFQTSTKVHVALVKCTDFNTSNSDCAFSTKVSDLIDVAVTKAAGGLFSDAEVQAFVTWRYTVDSVSWKPLTSTDIEKFNKATTEVKVQAWSKCGYVTGFTFNVVLHLNNKIEVCDKFPSMWYQTTTPTTNLLDKTSEICMHPKSDFAEVTFDYKPNIGLRAGTLEMTISSVTCTLKYSGSTGNATIVDVTKAPYEIVKEFAIDGIKYLTTDAKTTVGVSCTFTYTRTLDSAKESQVCSRSLILKDCTPPTITKPCPFQDSCNFSQCAKAKNGQPDIYQACGGNRISQDAYGKATITSATATCCPSCTGSEYATVCTPIRASPNSTTSDGVFIKRCDAEKTTTTTSQYTTTTSQYSSSYSSYSQYAPLAMLQAATTGSIGSTAASSALLGASALVAVVALVVVARRRERAQLAVVEEDAYYPLMG